MAEFKLGRIRFVWKGDWTAAHTYYQDDVVALGGKIYICVLGHTSQSDFFSDLDITPTRWNLVSDGQTWKGDWTTSTEYVYGDIVKYGAGLYIANTVHTSAATEAEGLEADQSNWDRYAEGLYWKGNWATNTKYSINDIVKYGGTTYVCNTTHTSAASESNGLETDQAKWDYFNQGLDFKSYWTEDTRYKVNDLVRYGSSVWIATTAHTSTGVFGQDASNWEKFVEGFQFEGDWDVYRGYQPGDIVKYGGNQYVALTDHTGQVPSTATSVWSLFSEGISYKGEWGEDSTNQDYRVGDLVKLGGYTYLCTTDNNNQAPPNANYWEKFTSGFDWRGEWLDDATYNEGDVVRYGDNSYICINSHISDGDDYSSGTTGAENSRPDLDLNGTYWSIMAVGTEQSVLTTKGDLVYYSGSAPQRLPIGRNGQILSVGADGLPNWEFLGDAEDVYYVAEHGVDSPAPEYGKSIDRPWRSIRYATQQVDRGAKNRNAAKLLEINRRFIQREIVEWTDYQITNGLSPFASDFSFDSFYCERDMGLILDALIWDITHGGNVRSREAALSYVETATEIYTKGQEDETNASINYGLEVIEAVLNNTAPAANYQTLNGDNSTAVVEQYFDINLEVEDVITEITNLTKIITDAITAGNDRNIPARLIRNTLIKVSTGKYYEVLPINVPAECCILGDELRSTHVLPRKANNATLTPKKDVRFSYEAVNQMEKVVGDIVRGRAVTPTTGNTATQDQSWPYAETAVVAPQVEKLSRTIKRSIDRSIGDKIEAIYTPHYEMSNQDYGRSRDLFLANREFIQAEIVAYITSQFPNVRYSKTKCKQDVGLIMDAVAYDLTYGGNWQSVVAGQAYFNGSSGTLQIDSEELAATLASYAYLKELLQTTGRNITVTPTYQDPEVANDYTTVDVPQVNGIGGNAGASTVIGSLMDDLITVVEDGFANSPTITYPTIATGSDAETLKTAVDAAKGTIQETTIDFISKNFGSFRYNSATCRRDLRNILTDVAYDVALGTNYNAIFNGAAYNRPTNAYNLASQKVETIGAVRYARDITVDELSDATAISRTRGAFVEIVDMIENGLGAADTLTYPVPGTLPTTNADDAFNDLEANKAFIQAEVVAWIDDQITEFNITNPSPGSIWFEFSYDSTKCSRDVGFIVEAMKYDILYGGTMATTRIAESYFGINGDAYPAGQGAQTAEAYDRLATILDEIVREQDVTTSSGNAETQTKLGSAATSTEGNLLLANMQIIEDVITAGNLDNLPAATYPDLTALAVSSTLRTEKTAIDDAQAQIILDTIQYISDTYNDFNYNHAKCSRDVGLIIDAFLYDYALDTNFASIVAAYSYLRAPSTNVLKDQKTASLAAFEYARTQVEDVIDNNIASPNAYIALNNTWDWIDDTILSGNAEGGNSAVDDFEVYNAIRMLELNKDFITAEIQAHIDDWFTVGVSQVTTNNSIVVSDTGMLKPNDPVKFAEYYDDSTVPVASTGLDVDTVYYVRDIISDTEITISQEPGGTEFALAAENSGFNFDHSKCRRDTGLIIDAVGYDLVLNTNYNQVTNGLAYARANASGVEAQLTETVAGITYAKGLAAALEDVAGDATALSRSNAAFDEIIDILENGSGNADTILWTVPSNATADQEKAKDNLQNNRSFLQTEVIAWITDNYPALSYDQAKCERDVGYIVDALTYDILYGGNTATIQAARAYFVGTQSQLGAGEQTATYLAYNYLQSIIDNIITADNLGWTKLGGATQDISAGTAGATLATKAQTLVGIIEQVIQDGDLDSLPGVATPNLSGLTQSLRDAQIAMQRNKDDIVIKTIRYLDETYSTMFTISIDYDYNKTLCARDIGEFVDAVKWDLQWPQQWKREYTNGVTLYRPGCYKTKLASRAYVNAVIGSQEEDMFYMRNGTGLRMMTLDGLQGDLGPTNEYGTRRVTAGAYASLDPGWGPDDERVWITSRSPYLQNNTCFGYAATGQRIDGALHNGGNDSMVSNDFTQVISDGIGAHILNNGRAELVSVFTYYSHIGYLAETGGRIRATNGNNSYGAFGSVAEGVDPEETAITGIVDNRTQYNATVAFVNVNQDQIQAFEFSHAGNEYTEVVYETFGAGSGDIILGDEFRDGAVSQVRIIESPTEAAGGSGYLVVSNTAQTGDSTSLTLAATDGNLSTAYPGMRIQITGGAGQGLYGIVDTYNSGSKQATIIRESDGQAGWDHIVPGTPFVSPNSTSIYVIEPYASFTAPPKTSGDTNALPSNSTWSDVVWVHTSNEYINLATETEADGTGATFDVIRNGSKYYLEINDGGSGFSRLDTLTIKGSNLNGLDDTHDITITVTTVNSVTGAIEDFDFVGHGRTGAFVAVGQGELRGVKSYDGITWDNMGFGGANDIYSVAVGENLVGIATGLLDDGSSTFKESATVAIGGSNAYYSTDLDTWAAESHGLGTANAIAFGNLSSAINRFIIIDDSTTDVAYSDNGGATWTIASSSLPATGYDAITFGQGKFVAVNSGTTNAAYSTNGTTWNSVTLPGTVGANPSVVWGNGRFVCLGGTNGIMYSLDGITWYENSLSMAATVTERKLAYGQGVFVITSDDTDEVQYSQDGLYWQSYTLSDGAVTGGFNAIAFGNPEKAGVFVIMPNAAVNSDVIKYAKIGATPRARTAIANEQLFEVRLLEPGSGYTSAPTLTITDPNNIDDVLTTVRLSNGAVANPTFINRGSGYTAASATVLASASNGYADFFQNGTFIAVRRLTRRPVSGSNIEFDSLPGEYYKLVNTVSFLGDKDGSYTAFLQVSPEMSITDAPSDGDPIELRIRFSQVRLTGHDFLDIGTGNFVDSNYPNTPVNAPDQTKETSDFGGGRVFYTATDQDGNFRVGDLFSIEQATGVATLNADAFNIAGLQELTLGEVTLGGNSAAINEFSTDPFFTANSDTVVPTQRAVKAYIEAQIGGGGASLVVNSVTAGDIFVGSDIISTVSGAPINISGNINFTGTVLGLPLAYNYFLR
jgi:hypothetical protein